jgi:uncharacterized protein YlxW (UPF0749 family)
MTEIELKSLIKVIKATKKLGVTKLKVGTLEFELKASDENENEKQSRAYRPALKVSKKKAQEQDDRNQLQLNFNDAQQDLSTMHVEDPAGFERALIEQEIFDDDSAGEQFEEAHNI